MEVLRRTEATCPTCVAPVQAEVVIDDGRVFLVKQCDAHGTSRQQLSAHPDYWRALDTTFFKVNPGSWPQRDFMVRMTERCNLACPICLASANELDNADLDLEGLERVLSERRGMKIDLLAAEPTLRKDLEDWIRKVKAAGHIAALHTNGIKLADSDYVAKIAAAGVDEVFLQFDGFDDDANEALRGRRLLDIRLKALKNLREHGIGSSLVVVIGRGLNEDQVGETLRFALRPDNDHIREVLFLGLRLLGRGGGMEDMALMPDDLIDIVCQSEPSITRDDLRRFNKLYFALLSLFKVRKCLYIQHYALKRDGGGGFVPISDLVDLDRIEHAVDQYADRFERHPTLARARLLASLAAAGLATGDRDSLWEILRLNQLLKDGMNLGHVPRRFLLLGFITACDPHNFDAQVALNCGKGEASVDHGLLASGAVANIRRERSGR